MNEQIHAAESVTEGHSDKVCDYIADASDSVPLTT